MISKIDRNRSHRKKEIIDCYRLTKSIVLNNRQWSWSEYSEHLASNQLKKLHNIKTEWLKNTLRTTSCKCWTSIESSITIYKNHYRFLSDTTFFFIDFYRLLLEIDIHRWLISITTDYYWLSINYVWQISTTDILSSYL